MNQNAPNNPSEEVSRLLTEAADGSAQAANDLLPLVYDQLRELARQKMAQERAGHTLEPTALVHEAYLRLSGGKWLPWSGRTHFFAAAAEAMRRILVEHARARGRGKRGGQQRRVPLNVLDLAAPEDSDEIVALDEAICRLEAQEPAVGAVVRLRFYAGLSVEDAAEALGVSPRSINRHWTFARAWLYRELAPDDGPEFPGADQAAAEPE